MSSTLTQQNINKFRQQDHETKLPNDRSYILLRAVLSSILLHTSHSNVVQSIYLPTISGELSFLLPTSDVIDG